MKASNSKLVEWPMANSRTVINTQHIERITPSETSPKRCVVHMISGTSFVVHLDYEQVYQLWYNIMRGEGR